jgi:DNA polymerase I-like protein with 3'-5' exonuclease and polymerase domains
LISKRIKSLNDFTEHIKKIEQDFWSVRFKKYSEWKDEWYASYLKNGYVDLLTGFRCYGPMSRNDAINYPVQGAAFHCLLWSFITADRELQKFDSRLIGQVHDSLLIDTHPSERDEVIKIIRRITCEDLPKTWTWINVPLDIDAAFCQVDRPWSEKEKYIIK